MADLDMKSKTTVLDALVRIRSRAQPHRQGHTKYGPSPHHKRQTAIVQNKRHCKCQWPELLTEKGVGSAAPQKLATEKRGVSESPCPCLNAVFNLKVDADLRIRSRFGKTDHRRRHACQWTAPSLHTASPFGHDFYCDIMHGTDFSRQIMPGAAEKLGIDRAVEISRSRSDADCATGKYFFIVAQF